MTCFVTVGTTKFDALIKVLDDPEAGFVDLLKKHGFSQLIIQRGKGEYEPSFPTSDDDGSDFTVKVFRFLPSILDHIKNARLVISHAGAGSILETLRAGSPLMVVVNEGESRI
jgi:beta-1,4-N-acetylglucosaminyltransferase